MKFLKIWIPALVFASLFFTACQEDNNGEDLQGSANIKITDSPIDDADVSAVFVTVADVQVDGKSIEGFSKTTFDLSAYQNGQSKALGNLNLDAGSYNEVSLIMDYEKDADGNSPGCYVLETDGTKHVLLANTTTLTATNDYEVMSDQTTDLVIDFDLRKSVQRNQGGDSYEFVNTADLQSSLRLVVEDDCGTIQGTVSDMRPDDEMVIAYAYAKGSFDRNTETSSSAGVAFKGAVTSTVVDNQGNYELHFLENGDYEVHFVSYKDTDNDGKFEIQGTLTLDLLTSINLLDINVGANSTTTVDVTVTGIIPI